MALYITPQTEVQKYYATKALNQSTLSKLRFGLEEFLKRMEEKEPSPAMLIGSAVDTILTSRDKTFEEEFYVLQTQNAPSETIKSIVQNVYNNATGYAQKLSLKNLPDFVNKAIEEVGWQANWKTQTKVNKVIEEGSQYYDDLRLSKGKKILTQEQYQTVKAVVNSLKTNEYTAKFFDREALNRSNTIQVFYQLPIYFKYMDEDCKALLDIVVVTFREGIPISIQPIDLKTMSDRTVKFETNLRKFRYDIQAAWYTIALESLYQGTAITIPQFPQLHEYTPIQRFVFIIESITNQGFATTYTLARKTLLQATSYKKSYHRARPGIEQLMEQYKWYKETNWQQDYMIGRNQGNILLDFESDLYN